MTEAQLGKKKTDLKHLITGGLSGAISHTLTSPLERLIIVQQAGLK